MEYETIYPEVWKINGSLVITIPHRVAKGNGIKEGTKLRVMLRERQKGE